MGYRFDRDESVAEAVRRIAGEELDSVIAELGRARGGRRDEAIHEARKSIKKVRALMRLVQPQLGGAYRAESSVLRDAGQTLSPLRDAGSIIEIVDKLRAKYTGQLRKPDIDPIRRRLVEKKRQAEKEGNTPRTLAEVAKSLKAVRKRVKNWTVSSHGFPALEPGIETTFRKARSAFLVARKRATPEDYHEWRKRIKDHWYQVRLLENIWTEVMRGYEASLKDVESWLGDDHSLALLRERLIAGRGSYGTDESIDQVLKLIEKYQKELRENAESFGERIHQEKPRHFVRSMRHLWEEWRAEPKSLEQFEKTVRKKAQAAGM